MNKYRVKIRREECLDCSKQYDADGNVVQNDHVCRQLVWMHVDALDDNGEKVFGASQIFPDWWESKSLSQDQRRNFLMFAESRCLGVLRGWGIKI